MNLSFEFTQLDVLRTLVERLVMVILRITSSSVSSYSTGCSALFLGKVPVSINCRSTMASTFRQGDLQVENFLPYSRTLPLSYYRHNIHK